MDAESETRSGWLRFVDNFLQDRNIKWILAIGMTILLGSSLMLVSRQWDGYSATIKQLIVLAYTGVLYLAGRYSFERLALRRTGNMLLALVALLLPVALAALRWVWLAEAAGGVLPGSTAALLTVSVAFAAVAARGVFRHFLRTAQPTFTACYLLLGVAGAVVPLCPPAWAVWVSLALWSLFAVGSLKVNRHVFWLVEERRAPRVCGFLPIGLLGAQFLSIYAAWLSPHVPADWLGLGCVLVAVPVLLAADALAAVFQQRTGNLVRPLPWSIGLPLAAGLALCATGVVLSAAGLFEGRSPFALPPTAALAAVLLAGVTRRTGRQVFVWGMLIAVTLAYRYCPVFFAELARAAIDQTASAIREQRLPLGYYGLVFLPLLTVLMSISAWLTGRGRALFAAPLRHYVIGVSLFLLAAALTHVKAVFPVAAVMTVLFAVQTRMFRNQALALPALAAWFLAAWGLTPFVTIYAWRLAFLAPMLEEVIGLVLLGPLVCLTTAAAVLLLFGGLIDRRLRNLPLRLFGHAWRGDRGLHRPCQSASLLATGLLSVAWLVQSGWMIRGPAGWPLGVVLAAMLGMHAMVWLRVAVGMLAIGFGTTLLGIFLWRLEVYPNDLASILTLQLLAQWVLGYVLRARPTWRVSRAFATANELFCITGLSSALLLVYLPLGVFDLLGPTFSFGLAPWWSCRLLILVWTFEAARRADSVGPASLGCVGVFLAASSAALDQFGGDAYRWLPAVWAGTACLGLPFVRLARARVPAIGGPLAVILPAVLWPMAAVSLAFFDESWRIAGLLAAGGLALWSHPRHPSPPRSLALALLNWQLLAGLATLLCPWAVLVTDLTDASVAGVWLPLAVAAAASVMLWSRMCVPDELAARGIVAELDMAQRTSLRLLFFGALAGSLWMPALEPYSIALAVAAFAWLVLSELQSACRRQDALRVWTAQAAALAAVGYLASFGVVHFGRGIAMFAILATGLALWTVGTLASRRPAIAILSGPFRFTGYWLPLAAVLVGIGRHLRIVEIGDGRPVWLGMNSLAILLAAGFYFWQGIERSDKWRIVLSAAIVNVSLALLWRELTFTDPQFFMVPIGITIVALVELLKREIPTGLHNPLRYIGALVVLVSPTFQITQGSWLHLCTLMIASVAVVLVAMGLRVRALMYTGTAFLAADMIGMVVRGTIDHPQLLWVAGLTVGGAVLALGAACELHRERILQRLRAVAAVLETWE